MSEASDDPSTRISSGEQRSLPRHNANKRRRGDGGSLPRKRAATSCQLCRRRKSKCDNIRPQCGFCKSHKAICHYEDDMQKLSRFDPASEEILGRLDELKSLLLDKHPQSWPMVPGTTEEPLAESTIENTRLPVSQSRGTALSQVAASNGQNTAVEWRTSPESLLQWPIFREVLPDDVTCTKSFLFARPSSVLGVEHADEATYAFNSGGVQRAGATRPGVNENEVVTLCSKFIRHVHPRNPILDTEALSKTSRHVAEHGLAWDAWSCLLLIACGIACLTTPWATPEYFAHAHEHALSPDLAVDEKLLAEAYFQAACKRIGLLGDSITSIQCLFFASIYEKYVLRPVSACHYIQQAFARLQVYRLRKQCETSSYDEFHLEDRLFWSLVKAESELQPHVGLPCVWPQVADPPEALPVPPGHTRRLTTFLENVSEGLEQRGWYFYLAEISLRRRIEDTMAVMYERTEIHSTQQPDILVSRYEECKSQVDLWRSYLHPSVQFNDGAFPSNELAFYLQGRFYEWRVLLLRPFLCCALNQSVRNHPSQVLSLANEHLSLCGEYISHLSHHGRHGGIWFVCRSTFACALPILAGILSGHEALRHPNWLELVKLSLRTLRRWAPETLDVALMRAIVDFLLDETCRRQE